MSNYKRRSSNDDASAVVAAKSIVRYGECCKNHWALKDTNKMIDGCKEFMASDWNNQEGMSSGTTGSSSSSLLCDACGCHRSFHKKKVVVIEDDDDDYDHDGVYEVCFKNQIKTSYGSTDGCLEFIPSQGAEAGSRAALLCDACGCHRSFHKRREDLIKQQPKKQINVGNKPSYSGSRYDSDSDYD